MAVGFFKSLLQQFTGRPVDWDELEEKLIRADLGVSLTLKIMEELRERTSVHGVTAEEIVDVAQWHVIKHLPVSAAPILPLPDGRPKVIVIAGVNGTGKTTSTAKLAHYLQKGGHRVMLAAADTFRAAAIEQLAVWSERLGVEMIRGNYQSDPAALCHDAYASAVKKGAQFLICDTAGRLHNRQGLMGELGKITRILARQDPAAPHERLLVVDATTGTNAVNQAKEFNAAVGLTGLIVTKLDGSGKGGILVAIQHELGIPARFIGTGETLEAFEPFDARRFVDNVL
jgi:fused signal recognition particle receptor